MPVYMCICVLSVVLFNKDLVLHEHHLFITVNLLLFTDRSPTVKLIRKRFNCIIFQPNLNESTLVNL